MTKDIVLSLIDAINTHDVDRIVGLCSADHAFIDAHGNVLPAEQLGAAWAGYFRFMPLYGIEIDDILCDGEIAAVFGIAWGSLDAEGEKAWRRPAAWRARVKDGRVSLWQVYVDTKIVFDLLARAG